MTSDSSPSSGVSIDVLHVASGDLWAGAEAQLYSLCKQLQRLDNITVSAVLLNNGSLQERLMEADVRVIVLDETQLTSIEIFQKLRGVFKEHKPDIIHTHRQKENILASIANFFSVKALNVRTQHGAPEFDQTKLTWKRRLQKKLDQLCGRYLQKKVIAVSDELKEKLLDVFPDEHVLVVENGVDEEQLIHCRANASFRINQPDAIHIGIVGRLSPVKRVDIFIDIAETFLKRRIFQKKVYFHIVGDGPLMKPLRVLVNEGKLTDAVVFHGHVENTAPYIKSFDVLVMCSDHEGLPMTLLEAIVLNTPIVSHNAGALTHILHRKEGGLLSEKHKPESYTDALVDIINGSVHIQPVVKDISAKQNTAQIHTLYETLLQEAREV